MSMFAYDARPVTPGVVLVGMSASRGAYAIRDFLSRNGYPFEWVDADRPDAVRAVLGVAELEPSACRCVSCRTGRGWRRRRWNRSPRVSAWSRPRRGRNTTWRSLERGRPAWRP